MAKPYRLNFLTRVINALMKAALSIGLGPRKTYLLSAKGRKSGQERTTPVNVVEHGGARYLVSPYGNRGWTGNVRANGAASLRRGSRVENVVLEEVPPAAAAPVLLRYWTENEITRPYFEVGEAPSEDDFRAIAEHHPVFLIR
jgi:deazaflavin-dependent oxidoreductase (nitroreductase family)